MPCRVSAGADQVLVLALAMVVAVVVDVDVDVDMDAETAHLLLLDHVTVFNWLEHTLSKKVVAEDFWHDAAFGGIIQKWMTIFDSASKEVGPYALRVSRTQVGSPDREQACNELEFFCKKVYEAVLKSGFQHLETIATGGYSCWNRVVEANV